MKLYIEHYSKIYKGKKMAFAVREWVLRDCHDIIMNDLRFIHRKWISIKLFHNIWRNRWNTKFLKENITNKLPSIELERSDKSEGLYAHILSTKQDVDKLIILERQYLTWNNGKRINTVSTDKLESAIAKNDMHNLWISNINFMWDLLKICKSIERWNISRVHVLPAGKKNAIKHELFSLEWAGTLIWNNFWNPDIEKWEESDENIILWILNLDKSPYLKARTKEYIKSNINNFRIAKIDGIPVGCVEITEINEKTIELWALVVIKSFLSLRIWMSLIRHVESYANRKRVDIISLTNNDKLQNIYRRIGFKEELTWKYQSREEKSPGVQIFLLENKII